MHFDVVTLLTVHSLVALALEVLLVVFWLSHRRIPGFGLLTLSNALLGIGTITIALRPHLHPICGSVLANGVIFAGMGAIWYGLRIFYGKAVDWRAATVAIASFVIAVAYIVLVLDDFRVRVVVTSAVYAVLSFLIARELLPGRRASMRSISWVAATLFLVQGGSFLLRIIRILAVPEDGDLLSGNAVTSGFLLATIVNSILLVACLVMLAAQRLQDELEAALMRVEAASRGKSEFLATVSHELRTPLNAIIGFSEVMKQQLLGPLGSQRYVGYAEDIHASGTHLLDLISTLLDVAKAEAGKLEISPERVDVARIAQTAVRLVTEVAAKRGVALRLTIADPPPACWADERALKQILLNLLSNAVKFTPAGGRVVVAVDCGRDGGTFLRCTDTGIGIAPTEIARLVKPFEQMSNAYSRAEGGTGLGLPLVDALVRLHGGELRIESAPGAGTEVSVWLPPQGEPAARRGGRSGAISLETAA